jgi:hypothetical protein
MRAGGRERAAGAQDHRLQTTDNRTKAEDRGQRKAEKLRGAEEGEGESLIMS